MTKKLLVLTLGVGLSGATANASNIMMPDKKVSPDSVHIINEIEVLGRTQHTPLQLSKTKIPLEKLPLTINRIDASQLRLRGYFDPIEALRYVPAADFRMSYGAFLQLNIRGFDHSPIITDGMRDERSTINSYPLGDLSDIESIEVLKGPASVLQGHSAVGGVLSINRRRPTARRSLSARFEYGSWHHHRLVASYSGKLFGRWNALAGISYKGGNGWRDTKDKRFKVYGALSAQWERDSLMIRTSFQRDFYGTEIGLPAVLNERVYRLDGTTYLEPRTALPGLKRNARYNNESDEMYNKNWNISLAWTHKINDKIQLTNNTSYSDDAIDYFSTEELSYPRSQEFDLTGLPSVAPYKYYIETKTKRTYIDMDHVQLTYPLRFEHQARTLQSQLQFSGHFFTGAIKHNWAVGYAASYMRRTTFTGYDFQNGGTDITGPGLFSIIDAYNPKSAGPMSTKFSGARPSHTWSQGLYAQNVVELLPSLQMMMAMRYDRYAFGRASTKTIGGKRQFDDPDRSQYSWAKSQSLTYRFGLVYTPIKPINLYASVANFYFPYQTMYDDKTIYVDANGEIFVPVPNQEIFKPRTGYQLESGARIKLAQWFTLNGSVFHIEQNNIVKSLGTETEIINGRSVKKTIRGQVGTITSKGFEVEAKLSPIEGMNISLGYSLTDIRYSKLAPNKFLNLDVEEGNPLNYIPKHKIMSYGNYTLQHGVLRGLDLHYSISYRSRRYTNYSRGYSFDPDIICDLGIAYRIGKGLTIGADVYNLFNQQTIQQSLGNQWVPNAPTNFKVSIGYRL